jgi:hypothetical protein
LKHKQDICCPNEKELLVDTHYGWNFNIMLSERAKYTRAMWVPFILSIRRGKIYGKRSDLSGYLL